MEGLLIVMISAMPDVRRHYVKEPSFTEANVQSHPLIPMVWDDFGLEESEVLVGQDHHPSTRALRSFPCWGKVY